MMSGMPQQHGGGIHNGNPQIGFGAAPGNQQVAAAAAAGSMMPGNNGGSFHSSFANNSAVGTANYPQNGMWPPGNQFQSAGQFGNSGGPGVVGGGHNHSQTNMSGFQCYNSTNGFQAMPPQQQQQWQHHQSSGSWSGQQWPQNQTRPNGAQGQALPQMKTGDSYQRTCDYVQKCKAWTGGGGGGGGSGESA